MVAMSLVSNHPSSSRISSSISQHEATKVKEIPLKEKLSPDNITVVRSDRLTDGYCRSPVVHNGKFGNTPEISQTSQQVSKSITVAEPYQKITQALREWSTTETKRFLSSKHLNDSSSKNGVSNSIETFETNNVLSKTTLSENNRDERSTAEEGKTEIQVII